MSEKIELKLPVDGEAYAVNEFDPNKAYLVTYDPSKVSRETIEYLCTTYRPLANPDGARLDLTFIPTL